MKKMSILVFRREFSNSLSLLSTLFIWLFEKLLVIDLILMLFFSGDVGLLLLLLLWRLSFRFVTLEGFSMVAELGSLFGEFSFGIFICKFMGLISWEKLQTDFGLLAFCRSLRGFKKVELLINVRGLQMLKRGAFFCIYLRKKISLNI